jgi:uncharacterized membrane protein
MIDEKVGFWAFLLIVVLIVLAIGLSVRAFLKARKDIGS